MRRRQRWARRLAVLAAVITGAILATQAVSYRFPMALCAGRFALGVNRFGLNLVEGSNELARDGLAWQVGSAGKIALGAAENSWLPEHGYARIMNSSPAGPATVARLHILFVPLWPWAIPMGLVGGGLWWLSLRKAPTGRCVDCNYDLRGLDSSRCPECGTRLQRLITLLRGVLARRDRPQQARF